MHIFETIVPSHASNAPCHTSKCIPRFFSEQHIQVMKWSAQSPDLNQIENLWKILGDKTTQTALTTTGNARKGLVQETCYVLRQSMCRRDLEQRAKSIILFEVPIRISFDHYGF